VAERARSDDPGEPKVKEAKRALVLLAFAACAKKPAVPVPDTSDAWVTETLASLSLEEKVGQMILAPLPGVFVHERNAAWAELRSAAADGRIGGVIFFRGDPLSTAALGNELQETARLPLLVASDYEWGAGFRVDGATRFPTALAVGAGGSEEDARFQGEETAREARALGVNLLLAPVVDLNVSPENSVINYRSFGEDHDRAGRLASAFIRAATAGGVLTTAKHFPGHGGTDVDSHLGLPVLSFDRKRLESVELPPFRAAIQAGVSAVMPAHMAVPALDGRTDRPATFSAPMLQDVLRRELGFEGLIVTDALDMRGARGGLWVGEAAVLAVQAGCDLLLMPPDPRVAWQSVVRAVRHGEIPEEQIDGSVGRILSAKARVKLHERRTVDLRDLTRRVGSPDVFRRVQAIADRAVTLLGNQGGVLPFHAERPPRILLVTYVQDGDRAADPSTLRRELGRRVEAFDSLALFSSTAAARGADLRRRSENADVVLVASFARTRSSEGRGDLPPELRAALGEVAAERPVVLAALGNPYVLAENGGLTALLAAYDFSPAAQTATVKALFGEIEIQGKLPVHLSDVYPVGDGMRVARRSLELQPASPEEAGFSGEKLRRAVHVLEQGVDSRAFPGGVAVVARRGKLVLEQPFGRLDYEKKSDKVGRETLYDLASLTKVIGTTTTAMILYERGDLVLEKPVRDFIPEFAGGDKDRVTVADLLAHTSGVLWWKDFYKEFSGPDAKAKYIRAICELPLDYAPRSKMVYSDLGILLLGEILERVSGRTINALYRDEIFEPLGMTETRYRPGAALLPRVAPTEIDPWRRRLVRGEVHDENALALGGVAPHAGLFSTGKDLATFAQMLLNGGVYGGRRIVKRSTIERFTRRAELSPGSSRALGWDTPSENSSAGKYFSASSFGHTGFTGTSIWVDPERELMIILLTNRVHPTRENPQIQKIRPAFADAVVEALLDFKP